MSDEILAQYTFVPWLRRGLASEIIEADNLGDQSGSAVERAELSVALQLKATPAEGALATPIDPITKKVQLLGPGDINGIQRSAIIRQQPRHGARNFEANGLAYVEFYEEDFPWRYTPARPANETEPAGKQHKLRPWFALIVVKESEFSFAPEVPDQPAAIVLEADTISEVLPLHTETWAWAHVQLSCVVNSVGAVAGEINSSPDNALSRIICPRHLEAESSYYAFIIPTFETGRLAGLGEPTEAVHAQAPSWVSGEMPHSTVRANSYPVYFQWQFATGEHGDFESLVRALQAGPVGEAFGKRGADVRAPGFGLDSVAGLSQVQIEGALRPPEFSRVDYPASPGQARVDRLKQLLDYNPELEQGLNASIPHPFSFSGELAAYSDQLPDDPIVTPPIYARRHAAVNRIADAQSYSELNWLLELNLDLRNRAAAGLGVEVVQKRQEEFMERAWEQVGELELANQRLREAELAVAVNESLFGKHLASSDNDRMVRLTASAQRRILGSKNSTIYSEMVGSRVPQAVQSAAFKRAARPQQKRLRRMTGVGNQSGLQRDLIDHFNAAESALSSAPPRPEPKMALGLGNIVSAVQTSVSEFATEGNKPGHILLIILVEDLSAKLSAQPPVNLAALSLATLKQDLVSKLHATIADTAPSEELARRTQVEEAINSIASLTSTSSSSVDLILATDIFNKIYGSGIAGKSYHGVTVLPVDPLVGGEIARMTDTDALTTYRDQLGDFNTQVSQMEMPTVAPQLSNVVELAGNLANALRPKRVMAARVLSLMKGVKVLSEELPRRLRPVMAHPTFPDAMFHDLRKRSQDFIIPNYSDLPENTLTLLEPNRRFIESYLAGMNEEMARELLWREFPTDQRGTHFQTFWDTRDSNLQDNPPDIMKMHRWSGELGDQSEQSVGYLVLVIRGELFKKYPNTAVYAQRAVFDGEDYAAPRLLSDDAVDDNIRLPVFQGELDPDIAFFGFQLDKSDALGSREVSNPNPGWFFVLRERPGEINFGLDDPNPAEALASSISSWNDLTWGHLSYPSAAPAHIAIEQNNLLLTGTADADEPTAAIWKKSAADLAYILLQNPILYARHAAELLPG